MKTKKTTGILGLTKKFETYLNNFGKLPKDSINPILGLRNGPAFPGLARP